jgi:Tol biopolymer transport system component
VPGTIVYAKAGNVWVQRGDKPAQLTDGGTDAMPAISPDGAWVYYVRTDPESGRWRVSGVNRRFRLDVPTLMRIPVDGSAEPEALLTGRIKSGSNMWSWFIRQPAVSSDGTHVALISDGPDPTKQDVVLQVLDLTTKKLTALGLAENAPLGHQDPSWSPDGRFLLYVKNARDGSRGAPAIFRYDTTTKKATALTGPGYTTPTYSHDGRFIAATRTTAFGTDVVILDGNRGSELLRVTSNERSFDPVWSPVGDALAFLQIDRGVTDLWLAPMDTSAAAPVAKGAPFAMTIAAGLDAASRPTWWVPEEQIPTPPPSPTAAPATSAPAASSAP